MFARACCLSAVVAGLVVLGCRTPERAVPLPPGADPDLVRDVEVEPDDLPPSRFYEQLRARFLDQAVLDHYQKTKEWRVPPRQPAKYNVLVLSGGSADGAYQAGMLVGWSAKGSRPEFDVICGVSTGALVGALAFPGPDYDCQLQQKFTTVRNEDIFTLRKLAIPFRLFRREGIADNTPLKQMVREFATPEYFERVAAEHAKGRRFYVGTTNLDTKRFVVWDMGAIAARGTPEAHQLYCDIITASSAITGIFPPNHIGVTIDGEAFDEMHADGGSTRRLFFARPTRKGDSRVPAARHAKIGDTELTGSNLFIIVAGKVYGDPTGTPPRSLDVAFRGISTMLEGGARGELFRLFAYSLVHGMRYQLASVPEEFETDTGLAQFDPEVMTKMFQSGYNRIQDPVAAWEEFPPETTWKSEFVVRRGTTLTTAPIAGGPVPKAVPRIRKPIGGPLNPTYLR